METKEIRFSSKVDWWLGLILCSLPVAPISGIVLALLRQDQEAALSALGGLILIIAILLGLAWPLHYTLTEEEIKIRFGLIRYRIPYRELQGISPTRTPLSNPALSLDRLRLERGRIVDTCISPKEKDEFLSAVAARAPHLKRSGDRLVRAA